MMTIDEIRKCYGSSFDGYIECSDCPLSQKECNSEGMTGYEDCWKRIKIHMDERDRLCLEKHGHWICDVNYDHYCSNCNCYALGDPDGYSGENLTDYCPFCGAKMNEEYGND